MASSSTYERPAGYDAKKRAAAAAQITARCLNANINSSFNTRTALANAMRPSESYLKYQYDKSWDLNKDAHLRNDEMKKYVEKALQLRDERGGMPVVSSPIWGSNKK